MGLPIGPIRAECSDRPEQTASKAGAAPPLAGGGESRQHGSERCVGAAPRALQNHVADELPEPLVAGLRGPQHADRRAVRRFGKGGVLDPAPDRRPRHRMHPAAVAVGLQQPRQVRDVRDAPHQVGQMEGDPLPLDIAGERQPVHDLRLVRSGRLAQRVQNGGPRLLPNRRIGMIQVAHSLSGHHSLRFSGFSTGHGRGRSSGAISELSAGRGRFSVSISGRSAGIGRSERLRLFRISAQGDRPTSRF